MRIHSACKTAWAVLDNGDVPILLAHTLSTTRQTAISEYLDWINDGRRPPLPWKYWYSQGCRCARIDLQAGINAAERKTP